MHALATTEHRLPRTSLAILLAAWGGQAIVSQTLLLREASVLMFGSELSWGVVLAAWLLGVGVGASIGGRASRAACLRRRLPILLVAILVTLTWATLADLWAFRSARGWLGLQAGVMLPLTTTVWTAVGLVTPIGALVGLAFPIACAVGTCNDTEAQGLPSTPLLPFGHTYALESLGSLIGGAALSFYAVAHASAVQIALAGVVVVGASGGLFLWAMSFKPLGPAVMVAITVKGILALCLVAPAWTQELIDIRWQHTAPGCTRVCEVESPYQCLSIGTRSGQFTLYLNGTVATDFPDPYTFAPLAHFWMCQHPNPNRVLMLGGGCEGLLQEILRHPVDRVDYVEPDPMLLDVVTAHVPKADRLALQDPRVHIHHADARHFLKQKRDAFNLVIARLPEPTSALWARLYTDEFYAELRRAMAPRGSLCMTITASPGDLSDLAGEYVGSVRQTLRRHFATVVVGWGTTAHVLAATAPDLVSVDPAELARRYQTRGVQSPVFDVAWFHGATDWLDEAKLRVRSAELDAHLNAPVSTDLRPIIYLQRLALWEATTHEVEGPGRHAHYFLSTLRAVRMWHVLACCGAMVLATLLVASRYRPAPGGVTLVSIGSTGLVTMSLTIVWLFSFQNLYGYVYSRIGWIVALFMGGLVVGSWYATGWTKRHTATTCSVLARRGLAILDAAIALLALSVPVILPHLAAMQTSAAALRVIEVCISAMVMVTGILGGAAMPLAAAQVPSKPHAAGTMAGHIVSADHYGACLGALACGVLLVPVFGITATALLLSGIKAVSAILLLVIPIPTTRA